MLDTIISIKSLLTPNKSLIGFYQHLIAIETALNHPELTDEHFQEAIVNLALAKTTLNESLDDLDKSYYYLLQGIVDGLQSWMQDEPSLELSRDKHFIKAEKLNPNLEKNIESAQHFFDILEAVIEKKEALDEENNNDDSFEELFPDYLHEALLTQHALANTLENNYDLPMQELRLAVDYYQTIYENHDFISLAHAQTQLTNLTTLINESDDVARAIIRDKLKNGDANTDFYHFLKSGQEEMEVGHYVNAEKIYKNCSQYLDSAILDNFLKLHILATRGYIHALLSVITPLNHPNSKLYSEYFFKSASKLSQTADSDAYIHDKKHVIAFVVTAVNGLPQHDDIGKYIGEIVTCGQTLYECRKLYDYDDVDTSEQYELDLVTQSEKFYLNVAQHEDCDFLTYFHLASIYRLLNNETLFIKHLNILPTIALFLNQLIQTSNIFFIFIAK
jgi:hypothetical protein